MWGFIANVAVILISSLLTKPPAGPRSRSASDFSFPQSEEGSPVLDGAGTFWIDDAHDVWNGDFDSRGIYKKGGKK